LDLEVERSVEIRRPAEDVFAFVSDPRNDPRWCPKVLSCEQTSGDGLTPGARFVALHRPTRMKPKARLEIEIVSLNPPRSASLREEDEDGIFDVLYSLDGIPDGTRLSQRSEIEWKIAKPLQLLANRMVPRHLDGQMASLKRLLES
jgi:uncharacterized protein YndB with AHSA1/START domain